MRSIKFTVYGRPQQRGSKTPWIPRRKDGSMVLRKNGKPVIAMMDSNKNSKCWMSQVRDAAQVHALGELLRGPIRLTCWFYFKRPSSHFLESGRLKPSAVEHHCQTPDLSKLLRCAEDALTGIIWADDKQICGYGNETGKFWTISQECCEVLIEELE